MSKYEKSGVFSVIIFALCLMTFRFVSYIFIIAQNLLAGNMFICTRVPYTYDSRYLMHGRFAHCGDPTTAWIPKEGHPYREELLLHV